jgi:hypothetical protein
MSSRSLAAARSRRAGENAPPVSGNRPITSIGSQAAFAQQMPPGIGYNIPPPPNNVRVTKSIQPNTNIQSQQFSRQTPPQYNQSYDKNQISQQSTNSLPFSKLSFSDAVGLITLRLGRVEQWIIETDHENQNKDHDNSNQLTIPDNHKIIDNSILTTIINRLDSLEKNKINNPLRDDLSSEQIIKLSDDFKSLNDQFKRMVEDVNKHTIEISKNTEQVFRFNRELTETKDILKSFLLKYDEFTEYTKNNFQDYENALEALEQKMGDETNNPVTEDETCEIKNPNDIDNLDNQDNSDTFIMSVDLKNIINQELANI